MAVSVSTSIRIRLSSFIFSPSWNEIEGSELLIEIGIVLRLEEEMWETLAKIVMKCARLAELAKEVTEWMLEPGVMSEIFETEDEFIECERFTKGEGGVGLDWIKGGIGLFLEEGMWAQSSC